MYPLTNKRQNHRLKWPTLYSYHINSIRARCPELVLLEIGAVRGARQMLLSRPGGLIQAGQADQAQDHRAILTRNVMGESNIHSDGQTRTKSHLDSGSLALSAVPLLPVTRWEFCCTREPPLLPAGCPGKYATPRS